MEQDNWEVEAVQAVQLAGRETVCEDQQTVRIVLAQSPAGCFHLLGGMHQEIITRLMSRCFDAL